MEVTDREPESRVSLVEARHLLVRNAPTIGMERIAVEESAGRITAEPVFSRLPSPHYRAAAMDGIAVRAADTMGAADGTAVMLSVFDEPGNPPADRAVCRVVDTGSPLPEWADAVVRSEEIRPTAAGYELRGAVVPGRDVRLAGEDLNAGALLRGAGCVLRAVDIGGLLATGVSFVAVRRRPRIGVLATGSEVIEPLRGDERPRPGQVIEFNSRMLAAYAREWGALVEYVGRIDDDATELAHRIRCELADRDVLCVIAGSSSGRKDVTISALRACGDILFRGVDVAPGRPTAAALVGGKLVLAVPGYPVSAVVAYRELLRPLLDAALGRVPVAPRRVRAVVPRDLPSRLGVEELLRVCVARAGDVLVAGLLPRGAAAIGSLMRAHALLRIPPTCEGIAAGTTVELELLDHTFDAETVLVVAGPGDRASAALECALADSGHPLDVSYLGRSEHDSIASIASGEAHVAFLASTCPAGLASDADVYLLQTGGGSERGAVAVAGTLRTAKIGALVHSTLTGTRFAAALEEASGESSRVVRRA